MTMFSKNFSENNCYGGFMGEFGGYDCFVNKGEILENNSNNFSSMAEQEDSRTESTTVNEAAGSSSKDEREDGNWLQLGIGNSSTIISQEIINKQDEDLINMGRTTTTTGLVELNLLPETSVRNQIRPLVSDFEFRPPTMPISNFTTPGFGSRSGFSNYITATGTSSVAPLFFQQGSGSYLFPQHQEANWAFRPMVLPRSMLISPSSATSSPSSSFVPSFQSRGGDVAGPSFDFRIIDPPRRPNCGIWFLLQASQNPEKAPILPQVPKSYLRIKDRRMTVRLLMKYLANKLRLDNESEIEIRCRGERLEPYLTLQHVRDTIWNNNCNTTSSTINATDHIMVLHYARS